MSRCEPLVKGTTSLKCERFFDYVSFPNEFGHIYQAEARLTLELFAALVKTNSGPCYKHLDYFLCQAVFRPCPPPESPVEERGTYMTDHLAVVCQEMCNEAFKACNASQFPFTQHANCIGYASRNESDTCVYKNVTCDKVPNVTNGQLLDEKDTYYVGDSVNYTCDKNNRLEGNPKITCKYSGMFSYPPKCVAHRNIKSHGASIYPLLYNIVLGIILSGCIFYFLFSF